jgi:hypothetical protein
VGRGARGERGSAPQRGFRGQGPGPTLGTPRGLGRGVRGSRHPGPALGTQRRLRRPGRGVLGPEPTRDV